MKLFWTTFRRWPGRIVWALGATALFNIVALLEPQVIRVFLDRYVVGADALERSVLIREVTALLGAYVLLILLSRVLMKVAEFAVHGLALRIGSSVYVTALQHAFALPYGVFEGHRSGELLEKFTRARDDARLYAEALLHDAFLTVFSTSVMLVYLATLHVGIALTLLVLIPCIVLLSSVLTNAARPIQAQVARESAELSGSTTETIRNVELVKSLGLEEQETARLRHGADLLMEFEFRKLRRLQFLALVQGSFINVLRVGVIGVTFWLMLDHRITVGEFYSVFAYSILVLNPFGNNLQQILVRSNEARASMGQLEAFLATPHPTPSQERSGAGTLRSLSFDGVTFTHPLGETPAVRDATWSATRGETIAFVGPSGSGKSTMVRLLLGLYEPDAGSIRFENDEGAALTIGALRSKIGLVTQESLLFAGTVRENLRFAAPRATDAECIAALHAAAVPHDLDARIGEGGVRLSGGEKQRLAIARAVLRDPELLVFDEATSALDTLTEKHVVETIASMTRADRLTILVAHRLATVRHATRIYVLERGMIIEEGMHEELIAFGGLYAAMWREQSTENI